MKSVAWLLIRGPVKIHFLEIEIDKEREENTSSSPVGMQTHKLFITRHALYYCATITATESTPALQTMK